MNGKSILVVEDNADDLVLLMHELRGSGLRVDVAHTVAEAERKIRHYQKYRFVFVDLTLKGKESAVPLIRWIRLHYPAIPVIVLTGSVELTDQMRSELYADGSVKMFQKPFTAANLEEVMSALRSLSEAWRNGKQSWSWKTSLSAILMIPLGIYAMLHKQELLALFCVASAWGFFHANDKDKAGKMIDSILKLRGSK